MSTPTRALGRNGPQISPIGLGLMSIGGVYGAAPSDEDRLALLDRAHTIDQWFWDTADAYFDNEDVIGRWREGRQVVDTSPEYARSAHERGLKRLQTNTIDLYYAHQVDGKTPIEKTIQAMVQFKEEGKIRYLGLSEVSANTLRRAHAIHPIAAVQVEYSPFALDIEQLQIALLETCRELGIAVVAYSPVGREIIPTQATLAWLTAREPSVIPIPGTRSIKYLEGNTAATTFKLIDEENQLIIEAVNAMKLVGDRYRPGMVPDNFVFGEKCEL
ncbi:NADP-dependent oxidoreductase domain-containing protein [Aspergillus granulosus]|uniref:NADP-dependent oxidoreductase domain-containing protein n=1 Tax=Aspergillus granulosus TaxID=176169 RepID=A0ABR4HEB2_9EURO